MKLTEVETVLLLKDYLEESGWEIGDKFCLGSKHGIDIEACKGNKILLVEIKGARAGDDAPTKKREHFDSGQIKTHFGKALVKMLEEKAKNPEAGLAIAHPDDVDIRRAIGAVTPFLKSLGIKHFWVSRDDVIEE